MTYENESCHIVRDAGVMMAKFKGQRVTASDGFNGASTVVDAFVSAAEKPHLVVDLNSITHVGHSVVEWFFDAAKRVEQQSGRLEFVHRDPSLLADPVGSVSSNGGVRA